MRMAFNLIGFGFPLALSASSLGLGVIGHSGAVCWHSREKNEILYELFSKTQYVIGWSAIIISIFFSIMIRKKTQIYSNTNNYTNVTSYIRQLCVYPVIMLMYLLPNSIYRILLSYFNLTFVKLHYFIVFVNVIEGFLFAFSFVYFYGFTSLWKEFKENFVILIKCNKSTYTANPYDSFHKSESKQKLNIESFRDVQNLEMDS